MEKQKELTEYLITVIRKGRRNISFRIYADSLNGALDRALERYRGEYELISAREVTR